MKSALTSENLEAAVGDLCPLVQNHIDCRQPQSLSELELWAELATCILSSQVPFALASAAAERLRDRGLLDEIASLHCSQVELALVSALTEPFMIGNVLRRYRFPNTRARQLLASASNLRDRGLSLQSLIHAPLEPLAHRVYLIEVVSGFGPKQSSMFLRNVGRTLELAILDSHVLKFMKIIGLIENVVGPGSSLKRYEAIETRLREFARRRGYSIACLDWAVWVVMRVASREYAL